MFSLRTVAICFIIFGGQGSLILVQSCTPCGSDCCQSNETCEKRINGGTCFVTSDRVSCNSFYYCYRPTTCCGSGISAVCCAKGSVCDKNVCVRVDSSTKFRWYYIVAGVGIFIALIAGIGSWLCRRRKAQQTTQGAYRGQTASRSKQQPYTINMEQMHTPQRAASSNPAYQPSLHTLAQPSYHVQATKASNYPGGVHKSSRVSKLASTGARPNAYTSRDGFFKVAL